MSIVKKGLADPDFDPNFSEIADLAMSADDVRGLAQKDIFSPHSRRAIVVPNDNIFGLARMYEILRTGIRFSQSR